MQMFTSAGELVLKIICIERDDLSKTVFLLRRWSIWRVSGGYDKEESLILSQCDSLLYKICR